MVECSEQKVVVQLEAYAPYSLRENSALQALYQGSTSVEPISSAK
jgi:hypothetical protein